MEKVQRPYETKPSTPAERNEERFEPTSAAWEIGDEPAFPPQETAVRKRTPTPLQLRERMSRRRIPALLAPSVAAILTAANAIRN